MTLTIQPSDLVLTAAATAWYATPDYLTSRRRRALVKTGVMLSGAGLAMWLEPDPASAKDPVEAGVDEAGPEGAETEHSDTGPRFAPIVTAAIAAAVVASAVGSVAIERRIPLLAGWLGRRGVSRPNLAIGVAMGLCTVAIGPASRTAEQALGVHSETFPTVV